MLLQVIRASEVEASAANMTGKTQHPNTHLSVPAVLRNLPRPVLCRPCLLSKWLELPPATLLPMVLKRGVGAADVCLLLAADPEEASSFCLDTCLLRLGATSAGMRHVSLSVSDTREVIL